VSGAAVCLFRNDLRLADNSALSAAAAEGRPVVPAYVLDCERPGKWAPGAAARWWLRRSLGALDASLESAGSGLTLLRGETVACLRELLPACRAESLHYQRDYAPWDPALEADIARLCAQLGVDCRPHGGRVLFPPDEVRNLQGLPFRVFTPFWRRCLELGPPEPPARAPRSLAPCDVRGESLGIDDLGLEERCELMDDSARWEPGEVGAAKALRRFLKRGVGRYATDRDRPDFADATSALSPHLRFGEIGPRTIWEQVADAFGAPSAKRRDGPATFLKEIGWREFSYHLLHNFPTLPEEEFNTAFGSFPWTGGEGDALERWKRGDTGVPLVDAGMRQLLRTGWMHNRVRMVVASFLTKNLLVDWRLGQEWFWERLVDADIASNSASWQWVAGCGADAAPYFRVFNPELQASKFDPDGAYVRRFVPELDAGAGAYPEPMVSLRGSRERALEAYQRMKAAVAEARPT